MCNAKTLSTELTVPPLKTLPQEAREPNSESSEVKIPNPQLSLLDYEILLSQQPWPSRNLIKSFCQKFKHYPKEISPEAPDDFYDELRKLEDYLNKIKISDNEETEKNRDNLQLYINKKRDFAPFYHFIANRIEKRLSKDGPEENMLLQYLYKTASSQILQFNTASESWLMMDIKVFLTGTSEKIKKLYQDYKDEQRQKAKDVYTGTIKNEIFQAHKLIHKLQIQINKYQNELEIQIKALVDGNIGATEKVVKELQSQKTKLQKEIVKTAILETLNIAVLATGIGFGPHGIAIAQTISFCIKMVNEPKFDDWKEIVEPLKALDDTHEQKLQLMKPSDIKDKDEKYEKAVTNALKSSLTSVSNLFKNFKKGINNLEELKDSIISAQETLATLQTTRKSMIKSFNKKLSAISDTNLSDQTIVEIEYNKFETTLGIIDIKEKIHQMPHGSLDTDKFLGIAHSG